MGVQLQEGGPSTYSGQYLLQKGGGPDCLDPLDLPLVSDMAGLALYSYIILHSCHTHQCHPQSQI